MFNPSTYARFIAFFLGSAALLSAEAASPPSDILDAAQLYLKPGTSGWDDVPILNNTYDRSRTGTEDGCPVGWGECSYYTCYPLDGSKCCSDGKFCRPGYYCDAEACCREGRICGGVAPPPSTIHVTTTTTRRFTSAFTSASTAAETTSVGFSLPTQSTEFGTVTIPTVGNPTGTARSPTGTLVENDSTGVEPTSEPLGSNTGGGLNGAVPAAARNVATSVFVAAAVALAMSMA